MIAKEKRYSETSFDEGILTTPSYCCKCCIYVGTVNKNIFKSLCEIINSVEEPSLRLQLSTFCNCLTDCLQKNNYYDKLPDFLPQIEQKEVFVEWIFNQFRLGFLFCKNPDESGWNVIINTPDGVRSSSVKFNGDIPSSVTEITEFIKRLT